MLLNVALRPLATICLVTAETVMVFTKEELHVLTSSKKGNLRDFLAT